MRAMGVAWAGAMAPRVVKEGMMGSVHGNEDAIAHEHRVLMGEYGRAQARCSAQLAAQAARIAQLESELMRALLRLQWLPVPGLQADVREKAVLYVGSYLTQAADGALMAQQAVEQAGGRFLHHTGGDDGADDVATLEAGLVAADLVICQTGCVSHDAYWRVHDHCKRTGKQCVLVDQPQAMHFVRKEALAAS